MSNYQQYQEASTSTSAAVPATTATTNNDSQSRCWEYTMIGHIFASQERPWFYTQDYPPSSSGISYTRWKNFQTLLGEKRKQKHIHRKLWNLLLYVPCIIVMAIVYSLLTEIIIPNMPEERAQIICVILFVPLLCVCDVFLFEQIEIQIIQIAIDEIQKSFQDELGIRITFTTERRFCCVFLVGILTLTRDELYQYEIPTITAGIATTTAAGFTATAVAGGAGTTATTATVAGEQSVQHEVV